MHRHVTSAVGEAVFEELRTTERVRKWTLEAMFAFWIAVVTRAPASLRCALEECAEDSSALGFTSATSSSFERAQKLKWESFRKIFVRFVDGVVPECVAGFESRLRARLASFPEVWIVDGSGLDRVANRLDVLRGRSICTTSRDCPCACGGPPLSRRLLGALTDPAGRAMLLAELRIRGVE